MEVSHIGSVKVATNQATEVKPIICDELEQICLEQKFSIGIWGVEEGWLETVNVVVNDKEIEFEMVVDANLYSFITEIKDVIRQRIENALITKGLQFEDIVVDV